MLTASRHSCAAWEINRVQLQATLFIQTPTFLYTLLEHYAHPNHIKQ